MNKIDINEKSKIIKAIKFVEELSWVLDSKKSVNLKDVPMLLRNLLETESALPVPEKYSSSNPNKNYLIGILPNLFQDNVLFKSNLDLAEFAENILKIPVPRAEKRSKYELIGLIVCEITKLNDADLTNLVEALSVITGSKQKLKQIKAAKKQANFSWNDAIKILGSN